MVVLVVLVVVAEIGVCSTYILFIAENIQQVMMVAVVGRVRVTVTAMKKMMKLQSKLTLRLQ